jgi:hypothetical protein
MPSSKVTIDQAQSAEIYILSQSIVLFVILNPVSFIRIEFTPNPMNLNINSLILHGDNFCDPYSFILILIGSIKCNTEVSLV